MVAKNRVADAPGRTRSGSPTGERMRSNPTFVAFATFLSLIYPLATLADWSVVKQHDADSGADTIIARSTNDQGYTMEIYRDGVGAVRSRFTLRDGLISLAGHDCPTYQVDKAVPVNRSINDAPCISNSHWAEFVLGYVKDSSVDSQRLLALMNGITITYRFHLADGDYRETSFSLTGSKRSTLAALGTGVTISEH